MLEFGPIFSIKPEHKAKPIGPRYNLVSDSVEHLNVLSCHACAQSALLSMFLVSIQNPLCKLLLAAFVGNSWVCSWTVCPHILTLKSLLSPVDFPTKVVFLRPKGNFMPLAVFI